MTHSRDGSGDPESGSELEFGPDMNRLDALLGELKDSDPPPPGLVRNVMVTIESRRHRGMSHRHGETRMAKKVLIGLAAAAAVFIAVFTKTGWPPVGSGTEGTIGAAKRHQAQQLSASDVKLGDPSVQEFLQSDLGARLMNDAQARALLANAGVREALADAQAAARRCQRRRCAQALVAGAVRQALGRRASAAKRSRARSCASYSRTSSCGKRSVTRGFAKRSRARNFARRWKSQVSRGRRTAPLCWHSSRTLRLQPLFRTRRFSALSRAVSLGRALQDTMLSHAGRPESDRAGARQRRLGRRAGECRARSGARERCSCPGAR